MVIHKRICKINIGDKDMGESKEPITNTTICRLESILVSMGYRKGEKAWGKPVGFMLILAEIKDSVVEMASYTEGIERTVCWNKSKFAFDNETTNIDFAYSIALAEQEIHIKEASDCGEAKGKVFNFFVPADLYDLDL